MSENKNTGNKEVIQVGNKIYLFPRLNYETDKSYFLRKKFFVNNSPKTKKEYLETLTMSIAWVNIKLLNCTYRPEVTNKLLISSVKK